MLNSLAMAVVVMATCAQGSGETELKRTFVAGINRFGNGLVLQQAKANPGANVVGSPVSAAYAHFMLLQGSKGKARAELVSAFGFGESDLGNILALAPLFQAKVTKGSGSAFSMANAFVGVGSITPTPVFRTIMRNTYAAEWFSVEAEGGVDQVNQWASSRTKGRIPKIVDGFDAQTKFALLNAGTYDGKWALGFNPKSTWNRSFRLRDGKSKEVKTMGRGEAATLFCKQENCEAVVLPYRDGSISMLVAVPKTGETPESVMASWVLGGWSNLLAGFKEVPIEVLLPKFAIRARSDLRAALKALGVKSMFDQIDASPMIGAQEGQSVAIGADTQEAFIEADENGVKAAAVTAIVGGALGGPSNTPPPPRRFEVDRPFVFAIVHNTSGAILFLGICNDPSVVNK